MSKPRIIVIGGGAAGIFAAARGAAEAPGARVLVLERAAEPLAKVRRSGGGRCNLTHAGLDPRAFAAHYPRGAREMIGPLTRFGPGETCAWFRARGVEVRAEEDGRMFPTAGDSAVVVDALLRALREAGAELRTCCGLAAAAARPGGGFDLRLEDGSTAACDRLLLATGGCAPRMTAIVESLGHSVEPPIPSLFSLAVAAPWLHALAGVTLPDAEIAIPGTDLAAQRGGLLVTHRGVSGPAVLRLSAWGARLLHDRGYRAPLRVNWLPGSDVDERLADCIRAFPARRIAGSPIPPMPARLWEALVTRAGIGPDEPWSRLRRDAREQLARGLAATDLETSGRVQEKGEFVTCGGVSLREVDFRTSESRICAGLHFAGELLDIDGLTGGFNLQAAWTTGWIAGGAMAQAARA